MRTFWLAVLMICGANTAHAQRALDERRATVPDGFVRIFMLSGTVSVVGWDRDSIVVTGTVHESAGNRFAIGTTPKGAKLGLWSDVDAGVPPSHIVVRVPHRSQVWVKTTSGDVRVSGVTGGIDLFSVSGALEIGGAPREVYAETMGGRISLNASTGAARLKTASGPIHASGSITDLTAVTVSGNLDITRLTAQTARFEAVDGDIRYTGAFAPKSRIEFSTHAGAIDLVLPANVTASFDVSLYAGQLIDGFGAAIKAGKSSEKARNLAFTIGKTPSAQVTLRSFKGRIALRKP